MPEDYEDEAAYVSPRPYSANADRKGSGIKQCECDIREIALWSSDREVVPQSQLCQPLGLCVAVQTKMRDQRPAPIPNGCQQTIGRNIDNRILVFGRFCRMICSSSN